MCDGGMGELSRWTNLISSRDEKIFYQLHTHSQYPPSSVPLVPLLLRSLALY